MCCSVLQCVAVCLVVCCSVLQCVAAAKTKNDRMGVGGDLEVRVCVAVCVAVCCSLLHVC